MSELECESRQGQQHWLRINSLEKAGDFQLKHVNANDVGVSRSVDPFEDWKDRDIDNQLLYCIGHPERDHTAPVCSQM